MSRIVLKLLAAAAACFGLSIGGVAIAAGGETAPLKTVDWSFNGPFGTYDKDALQRGFQVYRTVCASCHGIEFVAFRNLGDKSGPFHLDSCPAGVPETVDCSNPNQNPIVQAVAAEYQITDGPDDSGDMFQRPGLSSDKFPRPYANEQLARMANGGALPPDLSLITKNRARGPDYLYSLLTGYREAPETVTVAAGQHYNIYFPGDMSQVLQDKYRDAEGHPQDGVEIPPGGLLAMPRPLSDGMVDYADPQTPETVEQYAKDLTQFLAWAAEPKMEQRKRLGFMTIFYLVILAGILYWSYREIWSRVEH